MSNMSKYAALHLVASLDKEAGKGRQAKKAIDALKKYLDGIEPGTQPSAAAEAFEQFLSGGAPVLEKSVMNKAQQKALDKAKDILREGTPSWRTKVFDPVTKVRMPRGVVRVMPPKPVPVPQPKNWGGAIKGGAGAAGGLGLAGLVAWLTGEHMKTEEEARRFAKQVDEAVDQYTLGTGAGALGGAGLGAAIADNPWEGALYGGLAGAPVGAGATYLARLAKEKGWV